MSWKKKLHKNTASFLASKINNPDKLRLAIPEKDERVFQAKKKLLDFGVNCVDIDASENSDIYINLLKKLKFSKNWPTDKLQKYLENPFIRSLSMLRNKELDGVVAGCTIPSSDVIRSSIRIIGLEKKTKWLSSMFLMIDDNMKNIFSFADCAVIPEPTSDQLSEIAVHTSDMHRLIVDTEPKVAFLSFSTNQSADHYRVNNVRKAVELFKSKNPNILCDGEIQLDAAINPDVAKKKNFRSKLKGNANILIFPNLDAGNIGYKLVQQFGGFNACGPLLLGLSQAVNDLSRGATVDDIVLIGLITALQAERNIDANL